MDSTEWVAALKKSGKPGPLMATLREGKQADIAVRVKALVKYAEDPAVGDALLEIVNSPPWTSDSSKPLWTLVFELVAATNDARLKEATPSWEVRPLIKSWLSNSWKRAIAELPEMTAAQRKKLEAHAGAKKPVSTRNTPEGELLAAIYARPDDDGPRQVYADALLENGDPRGEFISLQLAKADEKKQKALIKAHGKKWLGELAEVLGAGYEFRRGFLAKATIKFRNKADFDKWGSRPEWATVEEVDFTGRSTVPDGQAEFIYAITPAMKGLKRAHGVERTAIVDVKEPWGLEELSVQFDEEALAALFESKLFPKLRKLELKSRSVEASLFKRIKTIGAVKHFVGRSRIPQPTLAAASRFKFETFALDGAPHNDGVPTVKTEGFPEFGWLTGLSVRGDGTLVIVTNAEVWLIDAEGTQLINQMPIEQASYQGRWYSTAFHPDGSVIGTKFKGVTVIDPVTGATQALTALSTEEYYKSQCPISADGRFISIASSTVFDLQKRIELKAPKGAAKARFISPDHKWWVMTESIDGDQPRPRWLGNADHKWWVMTESIDSSWQAVVVHQGSKAKVLLEDSGGVKTLATAGGRLYGTTENELLVWDLATGKCIARKKDAPYRLSFSADGSRVLTSLNDVGQVLDAVTLKPLGTWPASELALSPDGKSVWAATYRETKKLTLTRHTFAG